MSERILVTYATRHHTTIDIAAGIAGELSKSSAEVTLAPVTDVTDVSGYNAFVIGSAIRVGAWLPEAIDFVRTHQHTLSKYPTAIFAVCLTLSHDTPGRRQIAESYLDPVCNLITPCSKGLFAGSANPDQLNWLERLIIRITGNAPGEYRDWQAIQQWAQSLIPLLMAPAPE